MTDEIAKLMHGTEAMKELMHDVVIVKIELGPGLPQKRTHIVTGLEGWFPITINYYYYLPILDVEQDAQPPMLRGSMEDIKGRYQVPDSVMLKFNTAKNAFYKVERHRQNEEIRKQNEQNKKNGKPELSLLSEKSAPTGTATDKLTVAPTQQEMEVARCERATRLAIIGKAQSIQAQNQVTKAQNKHEDAMQHAEAVLQRPQRNLEHTVESTVHTIPTSVDDSQLRAMYDQNLPDFHSTFGDSAVFEGRIYTERDSLWESFHRKFTDYRYSLPHNDRRKLDTDPWFFSPHNTAEAPESGWKRSEGDYMDKSGTFFVRVYKDKTTQSLARPGGLAYMIFKRSDTSKRYITHDLTTAHSYFANANGLFLNWDRVWHSTLHINFMNSFFSRGDYERNKPASHVKEISTKEATTLIQTSSTTTSKRHGHKKTVAFTEDIQPATARTVLPVPSPVSSVVSSPVHPSRGSATLNIEYERANKMATMTLEVSQRDAEQHIPIQARIGEPTVHKPTQTEEQQAYSTLNADYSEEEIGNLFNALSDGGDTSPEDISGNIGTAMAIDQGVYPQPTSHHTETQQHYYPNAASHMQDGMVDNFVNTIVPLSLPSTYEIQRTMFPLQNTVDNTSYPHGLRPSNLTGNRLPAFHRTQGETSLGKRTYEEQAESEKQLKAKVKRLETENKTYCNVLMMMDRKPEVYQDFIQSAAAEVAMVAYKTNELVEYLQLLYKKISGDPLANQLDYHGPNGEKVTYFSPGVTVTKNTINQQTLTNAAKAKQAQAELIEKALNASATSSSSTSSQPMQLQNNVQQQQSAAIAEFTQLTPEHQHAITEHILQLNSAR